MSATLTGPVLLPGDDVPWVGATVKIKLVAGNSRTPAHTANGGIQGTTVVETDEFGQFSVDVPELDADVYPSGAYYEITIGGGRFEKYVRKVQPTLEGTYIYTDPDIYGEDVLPPEFVQAVPDFTTDEIEAAVDAYFVTNPVDVEDEVAAVLAADPPLLVSENGADVDDAATFRLNIGAASDTDFGAIIAALVSRVNALELAESADPSIRLSDLGGGALVTAPGYTTATVTAPGGVITITLT